MTPSATRPLVSVVIPAFNAARTIARTLDTVFAQDYSPFEVLVVDDGSRDETAGIVSAYAEHSGLVLLRQPNQGVAAARNTAIRSAKGSIIAPLDADDLWHPSYLSRQTEALLAGGANVQLSYCMSRAIRDDDTVFYTPPAKGPVGDVYADLILRNFIGNGSSAVIRADALRAVGGFDSSLREQGAEGCEDLEIYLKLASRYDFVCIPTYLVGYRVARGSMSTDLSRMLRSWDIVLGREVDRNPKIPASVVRWGRGSVLRWLWIKARQDGDFVQAARYLALAFSHDPKATAYYFATILRDRIVNDARTPDINASQPFLSWPAEDASPIRTPLVAILEQRRRQVVRPG